MKELINRLMDKATVVTVNRRMARSLRAAYDARMRGAGALAWTAPEVMPLSAWLDSLWKVAWQDESVLDETRSVVLWERIIALDKTGAETHPNAASLAASAYKAYEMVHVYRLQLPRDEIYFTVEAAAFKRWREAYEEELRRLGSVDQVTLPGRVIRLISTGAIPLPPSVVFAGFDEVTPRMEALRAALTERGVDADVLSVGNISGASSSVSLRVFADERAEVVQAARWARQAARPGARVGVIVPELSKHRDLIKREFDAELAPASVMPGNPETPAYNISLGSPLSDVPLVRSALDILAITPGLLELDKINPALLSPYFASGTDYLALAGLDAAFRTDMRLYASLTEIGRRVENVRPRLAGRIGLWVGRLNESPRKEFPSVWTQTFSALLKDIGALGRGGLKLSSVEYQAMQAWNRLLYVFASLDDVTGKLMRAEAVARLRALASSTIHQPETPECGVEVMGLLEAAGMGFDFLWVTGCHDNALPSAPAPNPFIPLDMQRRANVPHSSHERELDFAKRAIAKLIAAAPSVIVSWPLRVDEKETRPSALFAGFAEQGQEPIESSSRLKDSICCGAGVIEAMPDEPLIPVGEAELTLIKGGTAILKDQSLCPFKAFALYRLNAAGIAVPEPGLSAALRGSLLHVALRRFWEKVEDSDRLKAMKDNGEMDGYIRLLMEESFTEVRLPGHVSARLIDIEKERFFALLLDWVDKELARGAFKVKAVELKSELNIAGLPVSCRIDRVDELDGGEKVIIDYKSGAIAGLKDLYSGRRPEDPQLQVYSLTGRCDAVSYAKVVPGDCRFVGVASAEKMLPGVKTPKEVGWDGLLAAWKSTVELLAREFMEGVDSVDPNPLLKGEKTPCRHCGLTVLCRITETNGPSVDDEGDDDGE